MANKFSIKKLAAGVLALLMVVTALPVSGVTASVSKAADSASVEAATVYRSYNPNNGEHLLTIAQDEHNTVVGLGYNDEGIGWYAPSSSSTAVYRTYNPNTGEHLLVPQKEAEDLAKIGWNNEGVKMYSDDNKGVAIYRIYNPNATNAGSHLYTSSKSEAEDLVKLGWRWDYDGNPVIYGVDVEDKTVNVVDAENTKADVVKVTFDKDAKAIVDKDNLKIQRVDGKQVIPVNAIEWSEDGKTALVTLADPLTDSVDYQVSYGDGSATSFKASVGKVASISILTASAEENVKTNVEFALFDANGVDVTSSVNIDTDMEVEIEGVNGAQITADTSKPSKAAVTLTKEGDKAKITVTYRPNEAVKPAEGEIVCTAAEATVGTQHVRSVVVEDDGSGNVVETATVKVWNDGTYCARFEVGTDVARVGTYVGGTNDGIFFTATNDKGEYISYDSYEVTTSNEDIASANIEDGIDSGKYARIAVSGNTAGSANILIKATKNGAAYTYILPVTVAKDVTLTGISATASRPSMSNAIDEDYYGYVAIVKKYSDGSVKVSNKDVTFEVADSEKNQDLSAHLLKVMNETMSSHTETDKRGASAFYVGPSGLGAGVYTAPGSKAKTYTINATTSDNNGKEYKTAVSVKVSDLSEAAWDLKGNGAKMEYSMEFTDGSVLDVKTNPTTTARLAAYTNKLFAGYVRQDPSDGTTKIGTGAGYRAANEGKPGKIYLECASGTDMVALTEKTNSATNYSITYAATGAKPVTAVAGENGTDAKGGLVITIPTNTTDEAEKVNGLKIVVADGSTSSTTVSADGRTVTVNKTKLTAGDIQSELRTASVAGVTMSNVTVTGTDATDGNTLNFTIAGYVKKVNAVADGFEATYSGTNVNLTTYDDTTADQLIEKINGDTGAGKLGEIFTATKITKAAFDGLSPAISMVSPANTPNMTAYTPGQAATAETTGDGSVKATTETEISDVYRQVKFGAQYSNSGILYDGASNVSDTKIANYAAARTSQGSDIDLVSVDTAGTTYLVGNTAYDEFIAKPGTYTVIFYYTENSKDATAQSTVTVKNSYVAPKVTVSTRTIDSFSEDEVQKAITISCDATNNTSAAASMNTTAGKTYKNDKTSTNGIFSASAAGSDTWVINYITVSDQGIDFIIPINATFKTE